MSYVKKTLTAALAAVALLGTAGAALAVEASAISALNVRSGPGTNYGVTDTLYAGESVEVVECESNGWCRIQHTGPDGWVSSNYLTAEGDSRRGPPIRRGSSTQPAEPDVDFNFGFDSDGNFSFGIGVDEDEPRRGRPGRPGRPDFPGRPGRPDFPDRRASACFYDSAGMRGDRFCVDGRSRDGRLGPWDNRISSFELSRGTSVTLCAGSNFSDFCRTFNRSDRALGFALNNRVSSYRVH